MAISTTGIMRQQLMRNPLDTTPEAGMEGGVTRASIVADLLEAMKDVSFNQLVEQYGNITGTASEKAKPLTNALMKDTAPFIPETPLKKEQTTPVKTEKVETPVVEDVPTPMTDAMTAKTLAPVGTVSEQNNTLMANSNNPIIA